MKIFDLEPQNVWDYENGFHLFAQPRRLGKVLAHYELYKQIMNLPGAIVECGVFKGASLMQFASFRYLLETAESRKIIGFDAFGSFPVSGDEEDQKFVEGFEREAGEGIKEEELRQAMQLKEVSKNTELIKGDILKTLPKYVEENQHLKIALLHIDVDIYEPTKVILEQLWSRVVVGGLLVLDDYGTIAGETRAVDEFFSDKNVRFQKLPFANIPTFIQKFG